MDDDIHEGGAAAEAEEPLVPGRPALARVHIKKRALRNKALSVRFDEKQLQDFVGGFHKRKKKRKKIAQRQLQEKDRLRRIEARKKRKLEKELAMYGGTLPTELSSEVAQSENEVGVLEEEDNEPNETMSVSGTKTYHSGDMVITVTTSELCREVGDERPARIIPSPGMHAMKQNLGVEKKPLKEVGKKNQHRKPKKQPQKPKKHVSRRKKVKGKR